MKKISQTVDYELFYLTFDETKVNQARVADDFVLYVKKHGNGYNTKEKFKTNKFTVTNYQGILDFEPVE